MTETADAKPPEDWQGAGFGLYIHWPFCAAKCPYCDFNSHVVSRIDEIDWADAYLAEIDRIAEQTGDRILHSVFFGGGTPSLMSPGLVSRVLDRVARRFRFRNNIEITLEANPASSDAARFQGFADAGVNRFSLGLQALDDRALRQLGRLHSASDGLRAYEAARRAVSRVSFDLIYARQEQGIDAWQKELLQALDLGPDHLSLYQLTIEDGTVFAERHRRGLLPGLPDEETSAALYELTAAACAARGLIGYEVSNFAHEGQESAHNLIYWRCGDFAGIGPGAHGRLTIDGGRYATEAILAPFQWLDSVQHSGNGDLSRSRLDHEEQGMELLLMGLRLTEGVSLSRFHALSGQLPGQEKLNDLKQTGHLWQNGDRIGATLRGRMVLNTLIAEIA